MTFQESPGKEQFHVLIASLALSVADIAVVMRSQ